MDAQAAFAVKLPTATASRKVMYMLYGAALAIGVALIVHSHREYREALLQQAMARSAGVTGTLSAQMNGARITRLMEKYDSRGMLIRSTQDAWYYVEHGNLRKSAQAAGLELPLTAVAYDRLKQELQVVVTSADKPALRDTYAGPGTAEIQRFLGHGDAPPLRFTTGDEVITVDAVRDPAGKITGALVARTPMATLESAARAGLLRDVAIAALIYALVGALLFRRVGRLVRKQETDHRDLQERHEDITHSISYAGKIQAALVPSVHKYGELFDDFFVLNRPRDVVSGDFHWYHRLDEHIGLVAAADCTGHGVPGAMMAAIACSLLNDLGREMGDRDPATLLAELNRRMVRNLHQEGRRTGAGDGMDIALCRVDRRKRDILFAGAFRPLYWMHEGRLQVINGDRKPVGGSQHGSERSFTLHRITYAEGDRIYLFSDGIVDQFGGPEKRKFMATRFGEVLKNIQRMPMAMQAEALERAFLDWKGAQPQLDDVCVLGIAV